MKKVFYFASAIATCFILSINSCHAENSIADAHIHYNWDHAELVSPEQVIEKLKQANVHIAIVSSTPTHLALSLKSAGGDLIAPFFSPYTHELGKHDWFKDSELVHKADIALSKGDYVGIGEVHFMAGFQPKLENEVFVGLVELAHKYDAPMLIHIDSGNQKFFQTLCLKYPDVKLIFAHAGGNLKPRHIRPVLENCPKVWIDFAARDPWRYGGLTGEDGKLLPEWKKLVLDFPSRFITGTDPVWKVTRTQSWDQPDDGWDYFEKLMHYHKTWMNELPENVQNKIRRDNVDTLLRNSYLQKQTLQQQ